MKERFGAMAMAGMAPVFIALIGLVVIGTATVAWAQQQPWQGENQGQYQPQQPAAAQPSGVQPTPGTQRYPAAGQLQQGYNPPAGQQRWPATQPGTQQGTPARNPYPYQGNPAGKAGQPGPPRAAQPPVPRQPVPRTPAPRVYNTPPFPAPTADQQQYLDQILKAWEAKSDWIKTFEAQFTRYEYDPVWALMKNDPEYRRTGVLKEKSKDIGVLKFKKPDKGFFKVDGPRPEMWLCDGKSIFVFDFDKKQRNEYPLPPELQGKAIEDGPLPFLFDSSAEKLKARFWVRAVRPPPGVQDQAWLEAYPRRQRDAADFSRADLILNIRTMLPVAIQLHAPNGKSRTSYAFEEKRMVINHSDPLAILKGDPFSANRQTPGGWETLVRRDMAARMWGEPEGTRR
ncbi:MAG: hypothetical protein JW818_00510 [Pirellulales bacterium]|nr:hypothetical protein [Pirellulales bacterium]